MTFQDFLDASDWGDASRTYEQGISFGAAVAASGGAKEASKAPSMSSS